MGDNVTGLFPATTSQNPSWSADPASQPFRSQLGNWFQQYLGAGGGNLPGYQGQLSAGAVPERSLASQMFNSAVSQYDPKRYADIYGRYQGIAQGEGPNLEAYMNAVSRRARNEWQQNVMPSVVEKTRGYGQGSVVPESIARAGGTFNENLAGMMAPYILQAQQGDIQNRLAGIGGMGQAANWMTGVPATLGGQMGGWAQQQQQMAQDPLTREYDEYKRASMGMLPYMLQFGQATGGNVSPTQVPNYLGQQIGSGVNLGLNLLSLLR